MVNYYGNFIQNLSTVAGSLHNLLKKDVVFKWDNSCMEAFNEIKKHSKFKSSLNSF